MDILVLFHRCIALKTVYIMIRICNTLWMYCNSQQSSYWWLQKWLLSSIP